MITIRKEWKAEDGTACFVTETFSYDRVVMMFHDHNENRNEVTIEADREEAELRILYTQPGLETECVLSTGVTIPFPS